MSDEDHEDGDLPEAPVEKDPGHDVAPQDSDHHRARGRKRLAVLGSTVALAALTWGAWTMLGPSGPRQEARVLPKSEPVFAKEVAPPIEEKSVPSELRIDPPIASFGQLLATQEKQTASLRLTAVNGPVDIANITLPFDKENGLDLRADACAGHTLTAGETCGVSITFAPQTALVLGNNLIIKGVRYETAGREKGKTITLSAVVEVTGAATTPPPPPPKPVQIDYAKTRLDNLQNAFLNARAHPTLADQAGREYWNGPQRPVDSDWSSIGFKGSVSTFPVDMTRVVTMDKDIPAVIKVPIDARNPSRAVATVERDIYGGDGRMVIIERGSTLVGRVAPIADSSEEKVAIEWQRLVRPDGVAFSFEATTGDAMGRSGALAHIDNRWIERFGTTALASLVSAGITIGLDGKTNTTTQNGTNVYGVEGSVTTGGTTTTSQNARSVASQQLRQDMQPLYDQFKREQLALPPIRTVPAGTRITVWPSQDLWLRPVPVGQVVQAQNQATSLAPSKKLVDPFAARGGTAYGSGAAGGVAQARSEATPGIPQLDAVPGAAPATNAAQTLDGGQVAAVDTGLGQRSASQMIRDRMTMTGSSAGSTSVNPNVGAYGYANGGGGGYGYNSMAAGGVTSVPTPPWGSR